MKRVILTFTAGFAIAFAVGFSQGGAQTGQTARALCDDAVCVDLCHGAAFCTDWGCVCQ